MWLDAFLYKLFSVELGLGGLDIVFSNLWYEIAYMERTKLFIKTNKTFIIFPLIILFYYLSLLVLNRFEEILFTLCFINSYLLCTMIGYPIKFPIIHMNGRGLIEDFIYSRYPNIPNGFCPNNEHKHLFDQSNPTKIQSKSSINLNDSSILFLTFESAGSTYFASLKSEKNDFRAITPFFDQLYQDNRSIISNNNFCLSPLTTPAHIAWYFGLYTIPEKKSILNINLLSEHGYTTIYLTSVNLKLYGLYDVIKSAGFDYILDKNTLSCQSDSDLLTKGIDELETILTNKKPFYLHIHSANSHIPYFLESKKHISNDKQRFLLSIEETDSIFEKIYRYCKEKVQDNLLTIISSDHGQAFGEHNYWTHGNGVIKQEINVPLIFNHPKLLAERIQFSTHFDLFPTILDLLGFDYFNQLGYSLFDKNRLNYQCLLWDGQPSRGSPTCFGLILNDRKYRLDLLRNTCFQSDWNDQQEEELIGEKRIYFEALIGVLAQYKGIIPYRNLNEKLFYQAKPRILFVTPSIWELDALKSKDLQNQYEFIVTNEDLNDFIKPWKQSFYNIFKILDKTTEIYRNRIDGVMGTGDFYGSLFAAYISSKLGLPGTSVRSIMILSHKYYSRQFQKSILPEAVPNFDIINPFSIKKPKQLDYPFFVKPVKGTMSILARKISNLNELKKACQLSYYKSFISSVWCRPFTQFLSKYKLNQISTLNFISESLLYGKQVTIDGFIQNGCVTIMGVVDSIMYPGTISFERFEYPSSLDDDIKKRMIDMTICLMSKSNLNNSCFNIEMFYNESNNTISIIEINPRMSYQFSDLFQRVDGISSFQVQVELSINNKKIEWISKNGIDKVAASFVMRLFNDVKVLKIPDQIQIDQVTNLYPSINVKILCDNGRRLSEYDQDIGSYRYAIVNMSGQTWDNLYESYQHVQTLLPFQFEPI